MSLLDDARKRINAIDEEMAKLFEQRMQAVEDVIRYKQAHQMKVLDTSREQYVIEHNTAFIQREEYRDSYIEFISEMMAISRKYQRSIINRDLIGYSGTEGAFSHIAAERVFLDHRKKSYASFEDVFHAVTEREVAYGVIPFENSYTGEVGEVLDLLMRYDVYIKDIYDLQISQNLLGVKGASLADIKQVYSKDQAIYQSKKFLEGRGYELIPYPNTALAAEYVAKENDKSKAAIAAKENAELYGLDILAEDINTSEQNTTRFIIISKQLIQQGNRFSLAFTTHHKAGALVHAMNIIAQYGFNMQSIKSRSIKERPWEYYFYVEIEGNLKDAKEQHLIHDLKEACEEVKILGAYQNDERKQG